MRDGFGRDINYLRLSVTERCGLRCIYCGNGAVSGEKLASGEEQTAGAGHALGDELAPGAFVAIAKAFAELGGKKLRLTGGEPLERADLEDIIAGVSRLGAYREITVTTNGQDLYERLPSLLSAGLSRVNISLDTLSAEKYTRITGGEISAVLRGVDRAFKLGVPVKMNAVLMSGVNDCEIDDFIAFTKDNPAEVRFIELMPIGSFGERAAGQAVNADIIASRPYLKPLPRESGQAAAVYEIPGHAGKIGFISSISGRFCADCNRARVTADGKLKPCLGDNAEFPLLPFINDENMLRSAMSAAISAKPCGHAFGGGFHSGRAMNRIGG